MFVNLFLFLVVGANNTTKYFRIGAKNFLNHFKIGASFAVIYISYPWMFIYGTNCFAKTDYHTVLFYSVCGKRSRRRNDENITLLFRIYLFKPWFVGESFNFSVIPLFSARDFTRSLNCFLNKISLLIICFYR